MTSEDLSEKATQDAIIRKREAVGPRDWNQREREELNERELQLLHVKRPKRSVQAMDQDSWWCSGDLDDNHTHHPIIRTQHWTYEQYESPSAVTGERPPENGESTKSARSTSQTNQEDHGEGKPSAARERRGHGSAPATRQTSQTHKFESSANESDQIEHRCQATRQAVPSINSEATESGPPRFESVHHKSESTESANDESIWTIFRFKFLELHLAFFGIIHRTNKPFLIASNPQPIKSDTRTTVRWIKVHRSIEGAEQTEPKLHNSHPSRCETSNQSSSTNLSEQTNQESADRSISKLFR